ncbi:MAG TPA: DEAD/DEAH box helicase family protein [Polyangiaceae bacterium]|jgi:superfamily II DNA or RNA helicase|nr:DEAD/DEAH box helicase family protein [Polyangiaceae bacterium]
MKLRFAAGTLELRGTLPEGVTLAPHATWDARSRCFRAPGVAYAEIVRTLHRVGVAYEDEARAYVELERGLSVQREPRPFQAEALAAWRDAKGRGVVVLPTGAGKSHVAVLAIADKMRSALVVAPTLDLVRQWYDLLRTSFATEVGIVGGGSYEILPLTVTTYDSACLHMDHFGARFGLVVFDECHHLPGPSYALAAELCLAPFRLGLTATPERSDGHEQRLDHLIGPLVYRKDIVELTGPYLAEYETVRVEVDLSPEERSEYDAERGIYLDFVRSQGIRMGSARGWNDFIMRSARTAAGQRAMRAYRRQRELSLGAQAKLDYIDRLLDAHREEKVLIFTQDNATAYGISRRFLIPIITHQTKIKERSEILERFAGGSYRAIATSKVLNEGVDVPDASVAIVISGSGSVREHVQRLGRILRRKGDKFATLYELVSRKTGEVFTSERRREHAAYGGS